MCEIAYGAKLHRLRINGECRDLDRDAIVSAIKTYSSDAQYLTIDLTAATRITPDVARAVVEACAGAEGTGCHISVLRRHRTAVDRELLAAGLGGARPGTAGTETPEAGQ